MTLERQCLGALASGAENRSASGSLKRHPAAALLSSITPHVAAGLNSFGLNPAARVARFPEPVATGNRVPGAPEKVSPFAQFRVIDGAGGKPRPKR